MNWETPSIYVSALNSHSRCDNVNVLFILVYVLYTLLNWNKLIIILFWNNFIACLKTLLREFNHHSWTPKISQASYFSRVQPTWNMDRDKIRINQLIHMSLTSKTVGTQSYTVFSLNRPEETSMRSRPIIIGAWWQ